MRILYTKQPYKYTNGIIVKEIVSSDRQSWLNEHLERLYLVESDFGNQMRLTGNEIKERYSLGAAQDYNDWRNGKLHLIEANYLTPVIEDLKQLLDHYQELISIYNPENSLAFARADSIKTLMGG